MVLAESTNRGKSGYVSTKGKMCSAADRVAVWARPMCCFISPRVVVMLYLKKEAPARRPLPPNGDGEGLYVIFVSIIVGVRARRRRCS